MSLHRVRSCRLALAILLSPLLFLVSSPAEAGGIPPTLSDTIGLSVSVSNVDPANRTADFDFVAYSRGFFFTSPPTGSLRGKGAPGSPVFYLGTPFLGFPAVDYGDGSTVPTLTLGLTSSGGGPGGTNVYRSLASLTHTYPSNTNFVATTSMFCSFCIHSEYVLFPPGSPAPTTFTASFDYLPTQVIGNLAGTYRYSGTTYIPFLSASVRYMITNYYAVTNTVPVDLTLPPVMEVPTLGSVSLALLGGLLALAGLWVIRRV